MFGSQSCLRCRDAALCSDIEIASGIFLPCFRFRLNVLRFSIFHLARLSRSVLNFYLCHFSPVTSFDESAAHLGEWVSRLRVI